MDWRSPEIVYRSTQMLQLASYSAFGMFILDFLTSLDFDLAIITGKKRFRLTFVPYLLARYSTLAAKITNILLFNAWSATGDADCARWVTVNYSLYVVSYSCSLMLALLRVVALSDNNWKYAAPLTVFYLVTVSLASYADSRIEGYFIEQAYACAIGNTVVARFYVYLVAAFDFSCLGVMFLILMRQRGATLWRLLFVQGLQYLAIACIAYIPSMILISLNLNDPLNVLPDTLAVVMICIAMQRMYRQLVEFGSSDSPYPTRGPVPSVSAQPGHGYPWAQGGSRPTTGVAGINILVEEHKMVDSVSQYSQSALRKSKDDLRSREYGEV